MFSEPAVPWQIVQISRTVHTARVHQTLQGQCRTVQGPAGGRMACKIINLIFLLSISLNVWLMSDISAHFEQRRNDTNSRWFVQKLLLVPEIILGTWPCYWKECSSMEAKYKIQLHGAQTSDSNSIIGVFDMSTSYRYNILTILIFSKICLSISIFSKICLSISIYSKICLSISIYWGEGGSRNPWF